MVPNKNKKGSPILIVSKTKKKEKKKRSIIAINGLKTNIAIIIIIKALFQLSQC